MKTYCISLVLFTFFINILKSVAGHCSCNCREVEKYDTLDRRYYRTIRCDMLCQNETLSEKLNQNYDTFGGRHSYPFNISIIGSSTNTLGTDVFEYYPKIDILKISYTHIYVLLPGSLSKLYEVTEIYITHNELLEEIKYSAFNSMPKLQRLDLSFNNISLIDDHALHNLQNLKYFIISHNKIAYVNPSIFKSTRNISYIDFSYNKVASIEASAIDFLPLKTLYLQNNLLKNVSSMCSRITPKLQHFDLSYNQIEEYQTCLQLKNLKTLKLTSVNLSSIDFLNDGFSSMQTLDLSDNNIEEIGHTLTHLKELQILNLSANKIDVLPIGCFSNLTKLQHLNLSHNQINELQLGVFQDLYNVINLDLSHNNLESLHEQCFQVMKKLKYLKIDDNNIADIDVPEFASGLSLSQVSLGNNKWKCLTLNNILKKFELRNVAITVSSERTRKNIHGIFCEDDDSNNNPVAPKGKNTNDNSIKQQLIVPNLDKFDANFKKTAFFELTKKIVDGNVVNFKKIDDNFKNTEFYNFLKRDLLNNNFSAILKRFDGAFAETLVYKSLQKEFLKSKLEEFVQKNANNSVLDDRNGNDEESRLQNYLDEGFRNSTFYKYFERFSENNNGGVAEKLVQEEKIIVDYGKHIYTLLVFVVLFLALIFLMLSYEKYQNYRRMLQFNSNRNNDTASGILMT